MRWIDLIPRITKNTWPCDNTGMPVMEDVKLHHTGIFTCIEWLGCGITLYGEDYTPPLKEARS